MRQAITILTYTYIILGSSIGITDCLLGNMNMGTLKVFTIPYLAGATAGIPVLFLLTIILSAIAIKRLKTSKR